MSSLVECTYEDAFKFSVIPQIYVQVLDSSLKQSGQALKEQYERYNRYKNTCEVNHEYLKELAIKQNHRNRDITLDQIRHVMHTSFNTIPINQGRTAWITANRYVSTLTDYVNAYVNKIGNPHIQNKMVFVLPDLIAHLEGDSVLIIWQCVNRNHQKCKLELICKPGSFVVRFWINGAGRWIDFNELVTKALPNFLTEYKE